MDEEIWMGEWMDGWQFKDALKENVNFRSTTKHLYEKNQ